MDWNRIAIQNMRSVNEGNKGTSERLSSERGKQIKEGLERILSNIFAV